MRPLSLTLLSLTVLGSACQRTDRGGSVPSVSISAAPVAPSAPLRETRWLLRRIASQPVADTDTAFSQQPFLRITDAGTAEGQGSCNRFRGGLKPAENDGELQFLPLLSTRMSCPALATETLFTKALQSTRAYRIMGDTLWLYGNPERTGTALARLEAAPAQ